MGVEPHYLAVQIGCQATRPQKAGEGSHLGPEINTTATKANGTVSHTQRATAQRLDNPVTYEHSYIFSEMSSLVRVSRDLQVSTGHILQPVHTSAFSQGEVTRSKTPHPGRQGCYITLHYRHLADALNQSDVQLLTASR